MVPGSVAGRQALVSSSSVLLLPVTKLTEHARADGVRYVMESVP